VFLRICAFGAIGGVVVILDQLGVRVHLPAGVHETAAAVIALILAVRTNTGFGRFWEGRSLWGAIVNGSRNLAQLAECHVKDGADDLRVFSTWIVVFGWVTRRQLRTETSWPEVERLLPPADYAALQAAGHPSLFATRRLSSVIAGWLADGRIDPMMAVQAQRLVAGLVDSLGGCEKIAKTPSPLGHVLLMERFIAVYLATLPFMLVTRIEILAPLATMMIAYPILLLDALGAALDDPFGHDPSHLPLTRICLTIEKDLLGTSPPPETIYTVPPSEADA
jgi:putative membrane protein